MMTLKTAIYVALYVLQFLCQHSSMSTPKLNSFFVDIKHNFCVELNNYTLIIYQILSSDMSLCELHGVEEVIVDGGEL